MNPQELDDLFDAYFLGDASPEQRASLEESLRAGPEARSRFVRTSLLEARLYARPDSSAAAAIAGAPSEVPLATSVQPSKLRPSHRLRVGFRHFDLAALAVLAFVAITAYYAVRVGFAPPAPVAIDPALAGKEEPPFEPIDWSTSSPDGKSRLVEGFVHAVDADAKTFVVAGPNEQRMTFRVDTATVRDREASQVFLDGVRSTFDEAVRPRRPATVAFVRTDENLVWVWKVEVSSKSR